MPGRQPSENINTMNQKKQKSLDAFLAQQISVRQQKQVKGGQDDSIVTTDVING